MWLRRGDKLRQAISWWRAAATGQYGLAAGQVPAEPPEFDRDAISRLLRYAEACEAGWRDWFTAHAIKPFEITYEDMVKDLDKAVRDIAGFCGITVPAGLGHIRPRMRRQADQHTERLVRLYGASLSGGQAPDAGLEWLRRTGRRRSAGRAQPTRRRVTPLR